MSSATQAHFSLSSSATANAGNFVERRGNDLYLGGKRFRFVSLNAPQLLRGDESGKYEVRDTFASLAAAGAFGTAIKSGPYVDRGHINGWHKEWKDWIWDEGRLREMDFVLAEAAKVGVKLIIPIINQDFGDDKNWVGCTTDLIRLRYGFGSNQEARRINFWTDKTMIESFKLIIDFLCKRVNSINGRRYGEDPAILAWETGNELTAGDKLPAPTSWTLTIAKHLKSRAPRTLVMDGSFARYAEPERGYPKELLENPAVDIFSYHHYGDGDAKRVRKDCEVVRRNNKVFVSGEFGFFYSVSVYGTFLSDLDAAGGAGALSWSFRPHSAKGGHKTHSEGTNKIFSYHLPGWNNPVHPEFDSREYKIISYLRTASFKINGNPTPPRYPVPPAPSKPWRVADRDGGPAITFQGSAWAHHYVVIVRGPTGQRTKEVKDNTKEGEFAVGIAPEVKASGSTGVRVSIRAVSVDGVQGGESEALTL